MYSQGSQAHENPYKLQHNRMISTMQSLCIGEVHWKLA